MSNFFFSFFEFSNKIPHVHQSPGLDLLFARFCTRYTRMRKITCRSAWYRDRKCEADTSSHACKSCIFARTFCVSAPRSCSSLPQKYGLMCSRLFCRIRSMHNSPLAQLRMQAMQVRVCEPLQPCACATSPDICRDISSRIATLCVIF